MGNARAFGDHPGSGTKKVQTASIYLHNNLLFHLVLHNHCGASCSRAMVASGQPPVVGSETPPAAQTDLVRPFNPATDSKMVTMLVGQGVMEGLARANHKGESSSIHTAVL